VKTGLITNQSDSASAATQRSDSVPNSKDRVQAENSAKGDQAPAFMLRDIKGQTHTLAQHRNKVILLNFWATWCVPCLKEFPHLQRLYEQYRARGFEILAVSIDEARTRAAVGPTIYRYGYTFTVLIDEEDRVTGLFNPKRHSPYTILIDRHGNIRMRHQGYNPGDERSLETQIIALLNEK
jgi:peroxiredoxin